MAAGTSSTGEVAEFGVSGTVITFRGFLAAYEEGRDETPDADDPRYRTLIEEVLADFDRLLTATANDNQASATD